MSEQALPKKENRMGTEPINKLLFSMAIPIMLSMMVQALYNVVDSIFVAKLSEDALTAVSLGFPMQNLLIAFSTGLGVGINALLSRSLGEKNQYLVNQSACQGFFLQMCAAAVFMMVGVFGAGAFIRSQTQVASIIPDAITYLQICIGICPFLFVSIFFERLLQATGKTKLSMAAQMTGALINIVFDPICIFLLDWGVAGAAAATVFGQFCSAMLAMFLHFRYNKEIHLSFKGFRPNGHVIGGILGVGVPSIIMASIGSVMTYSMNRILDGFTSTAVAVFGVYFKLQSFIFMPVFGLNNAIVPIIAYNYGARRPDRMKKTIKLAVAVAVAIMVCGFTLMQLIPHVFLGMFDASADMLAIGVPALRTISISFLAAGACIIIGSTFQALGKGTYSMTVSIARQLVVLVPVAWLMSRTGNLNAVWWAFPIAEIMGVFCTVLFFLHLNKTIIKPLEAEK
ncbi:MAG: MATE family efflux transporter [Clostridia bacterium]|nr:MATE family efflux transporter [Clostridia bacterium]